MDIKTLVKSSWPVAVVCAVLFYAWGVFSPAEAAPFTLLVINPVVIVVVQLVYAARRGFMWPVLLYAPVLYIPLCFGWLYNSSALIYAAGYLLAGAIAQSIGAAIRRAR
ncbi:MAG: hypothetical protein LBS17_03405 [Actinomycetes bacterium]|nr:hypothetical protein [Actinomycetes bacterium]